VPVSAKSYADARQPNSFNTAMQERSLPACTRFTMLLGGISVAVAYGVRDDMLSNGEVKHAMRSALHHPGHRARHVTRLHRWDHSGLGVFLEREAEWHSGRALQSSNSSQSDAPQSGRSSGFLQISPAQARSLRQHQQAYLQKSEELHRSEAHTELSRGARYQDHKEDLQRPTELELSALQRFTREHIGISNGRAVTRMSSLASQYVGPIGVGTTLQPPGCVMPANSLLHLDAEEVAEEELVTEAGEKICQASDQSKIWVVFDTGSTNIWVSSDLCERGPCAKEGRMRYNHTRSLTFAYPKNPAQLTVEFGTGKLVGPTGVDDFHIGPFSVFQQTFGMIQNQNGSVFEDVPFEGILGLAFPAMSANRAKPFFDTVIDQRALQKNEFAFYFSRDTPSANAIFWGGVEPGFYKGQIEYFAVTDPYYWAVDLHAFKVGDECLLGPNCKFSPETGFRRPGILSSLLQLGEGSDAEAQQKVRRRSPLGIVDTGTTYFTAEGYLFEEIMDRLPPTRCTDITDETHPEITYTLRNVAGQLKHFRFTKDMYMTESSDGVDAECSPAFMRIDIPEKHGPAMVLGEVFLRHYFAVFDRAEGTTTSGKLGLAPSVHTNEALERLHDLTRSQPSFEKSRGTNIVYPSESSFAETAASGFTETAAETAAPPKAAVTHESRYGRKAKRAAVTLDAMSMHIERAPLESE